MPYLVGIGAWLLIVDFILVGAMGHRLPRPLGVAGSWIFVAVSAALLGTLGGRKLAADREQARLLQLQQTALHALGALTEPSLAVLPADQLLDEMLARLMSTLGVQTATAYLFSDDGSELVSRASAGSREVVTRGHRLPVTGGMVSRIIAQREPLISDSPAEIGELAAAFPQLASVAGCPIVVEDGLIGICAVGTTVPRTFSQADLQLLQLVADRIGAAIERSRLDEAERRSRLLADRARRHVTLLARASEALSTAIDDYEPVVGSLVDVVVPDFADWCAIDVVEAGGSRRRLAIRHGDERDAEVSAEGSKPFRELDDLSDQAVRLGRTQQVSRSPQGDGGVSRSGGTACLIVPICVRGRTLGLMTFAIDPGREGYQLSDVSTAEEVAGRTAITAERVLLYRELQARETRWRALVEATPAGIVEVDLDGRVLVFNRFAASMFGWHEAEATPAGGPAFAPDTAKALSELWVRAAGGEDIYDAQLAVTVAGGEHRDLAVSLAPLRDAYGASQGILTLAADVTERRRLQEGLRAAQQMEALGQVAGGVAHDFNNLLTVITGYADLLTRRLTLDEGDQQLFDNIRNAADQAAALTGQLLTISRRQMAKPVVLAPEESLHAIAEVLQRILGVDISLQWELDDVAGNICIDPGRFEQLILNLGINARDAMPDGGCLKIGTSRVSLDRAMAAAHGILPGGYVRFTVADTGVGMDDETRRRCLEPFFTTKGRSKGTGLGLAAVQGIIEEAGGAIEVDSEPGRGTTFTLYLPSVAADVPVVPQMAAPPAPVARGSETLLVVDDQADVRQLVRKVLMHDGYLVLEAASGAEAIRIAERWEGPIELLVTDVMMPGMRGPEVASAVKAFHPSIEVLFTSGYTDGTSLPVEVLSNPLGFLAKPFKPSELGDRVRGILDQRYRRARSDSRRPGRS